MAEVKMADSQCVCTGIRTCLLCEETSLPIGNQIGSGENLLEIIDSKGLDMFHFCLINKRIVAGKWKCCSQSCFSNENRDWLNSEGNTLSTTSLRNEYPGNLNSDSTCTQESIDIGLNDIVVIEDFITGEEESCIKSEIYKLPWKLSQSGRRKQDFGPQANFKRKKLKVGSFSGLPFFLKDVVLKMNYQNQLEDFIPVEVCHLEYCSERGSSIDPHIDDTWLWGERLVTLNLLSHSILTLSNEMFPKVAIQVPLPRYSLMVLQGNARNTWKHSIERKDVDGMRLALTFRELSQEFISGSQCEVGAKIVQIARNFNGKPLYSGGNCGRPLHYP